MINTKRKQLIVLLTRYNSRKFIESIIALLDTEEEIDQVIQFIIDNPDVTKTDIHEKIIKMRF